MTSLTHHLGLDRLRSSGVPRYPLSQRQAVRPEKHGSAPTPTVHHPRIVSIRHSHPLDPGVQITETVLADTSILLSFSHIRAHPCYAPAVSSSSRRRNRQPSTHAAPTPRPPPRLRGEGMFAHISAFVQITHALGTTQVTLHDPGGPCSVPPPPLPPPRPHCGDHTIGDWGFGGCEGEVMSDMRCAMCDVRCAMCDV
jgi:hypothetical protein